MLRALDWVSLRPVCNRTPAPRPFPETSTAEPSLSTDGIAWTHVSPDAFDSVQLQKVVEFGDYLYAFGSHCSTEVRCGNYLGIANWNVWRSSNGLDWEELPASPSLQSQVISDVVVNQGELLALGQLNPGDGTTDWPSATWRSTDGITWTEPDTLGDLPGHARAASIDSIVVAIDPEPFGFYGRVWYSDDVGKSWTKADLPSGSSCDVKDVAAVSEQFVVVGAAIPEVPLSPCSWASADGATWSGGFSNHPSIGFTTVVGVGDQALAVGGGYEDQGMFAGMLGALGRRVLGSGGALEVGSDRSRNTQDSFCVVAAGAPTGAVALGPHATGDNSSNLALNWASWFIPVSALPDSI